MIELLSAVSNNVTLDSHVVQLDILQVVCSYQNSHACRSCNIGQKKTSAVHFSNVQKMFVLSAIVDCHHFFTLIKLRFAE